MPEDKEELFPFDPYHRFSIRLKEYDYALPGAYFVTIATHRREMIFGEIKSQFLELNDFGNIVQDHWRNLTQHYSNINLGCFVVMPNHFHGIIIIRDQKSDHPSNIRAGLRPAPTQNISLHKVVRTFKSFTAREINKLRYSSKAPVWQRNYYEHIIRTDEEFYKIEEYINENVINWDKDNENLMHD
jgi:putative transposase